MRLIIPFIRTVVWGEESPKTTVRMFFLLSMVSWFCIAIDKVSYSIGQIVMFVFMARCLPLYKCNKDNSIALVNKMDWFST